MVVAIIGWIAYSLLIVIMYYRREVKGWLKNGKSLFQKEELNGSNAKIVEDKATASYPGNNKDDIEISLQFGVVYKLLKELKELVLIAAQRQYVKEELLTALQVQLKSRQQLRGTAFQVAVKNHIRIEVEKDCGFRLSHEDLKRA